MLDTATTTISTDQAITAWQVVKTFWPILLAFLTGLIGYWIGALKNYYEMKQAALVEVMPNVLKVMLPTNTATNDIGQLLRSLKIDNEQFNRSLHMLWLYSSTRTAKAVDELLRLVMHPEDGNRIEAAQKAIVQMRKELLPPGLRWISRLSPEDIKHFQFNFEIFQLTPDASNSKRV